MKRAFIFDVDGVLINSEPLWDIEKEKISLEFFDEGVRNMIGSTTGLGVDGIYDRVLSLGAKVEKSKLAAAFDVAANNVYRQAPLTPGLEDFERVLAELGCAIGIVTNSQFAWVEEVIRRLPFKDRISNVISLQDRPDLANKPAPDGYIESMRQLGVTPMGTIVLEDSNVGIAAARSAGSYTIGFKQNLTLNYDQQGATTYANDLAEVAEIARAFYSH